MMRGIAWPTWTCASTSDDCICICICACIYICIVFVRYCLTHLDVCQHKWWQPVCISYTATQIVVSFSAKRNSVFWSFEILLILYQMFFTLIVRWWRELGPFGPMAIILDAASPLATRLSLHLMEVVNFVVDQLARNHQSLHWDQSGLNQGFTMTMRRRNYWMWRHHQSVGGDPQNPPEDLWILRSLVIHKTTCPVFAFLSQHQRVTHSHCIVDSTIQKNPPWRCDHLRGQRKPQATTPNHSSSFVQAEAMPSIIVLWPSCLIFVIVTALSDIIDSYKQHESTAGQLVWAL